MSAQVENMVVLFPSTFSGVLTGAPVTFPVRVSSGGLRACRVDITCTGVTVVGSITLILQHSSDGTNWSDTKSVSVVGNGQVGIKFLDTVAADQTHLPLRPLARLVATTTNAGDTFTVSNAKFMIVRGI